MVILGCGDRFWADGARAAEALAAWEEAARAAGDRGPHALLHGDNGYDRFGAALWGKPDHIAARGADKLLGAAAAERRWRVEAFSPEWDRYRPRDPRAKNPAGVIRNTAMLAALLDAREKAARDADARDTLLLVLALHDRLEESRGTRDTVRKALGRGVAVYHVWRPRPNAARGCPPGGERLVPEEWR